MNIFYFALLLAFFLYGLFFERTITVIQGVIFGFYLIGYFLTPNSKYCSLRRKIMIAIFHEQEEGNILARFEGDVTKINKILEEFPKESRPSITHFMIRMVAEIFKTAPDMNGRICFGKFVPYDSVDMGCLVDINEGKDLANILIPNCENMYVEDIRDFIKDKAIKLKKNEDKDHKEQTNTFKMLPSSVIQIVFDLITFLTVTLGLSITPLKLKRFPFGVGCVTSLGMLGIRDAFAPNNLVTRNVLWAAIGAIHDRVKVVNDKLEVRPCIFINFTVDHRFLDGGRTKNLNKIVYDCFENPEKYFKCKLQQTEKNN